MTQDNQPREATIEIDEDCTYTVRINEQRVLGLNHYACLNGVLVNLWCYSRAVYDTLVVPPEIGTRHPFEAVITVMCAEELVDPGPDDDVGRLYRTVSRSPTLEGVDLNAIQRHVLVSCRDVWEVLESDNASEPREARLWKCRSKYPNDLYIPPFVS